MSQGRLISSKETEEFDDNYLKNDEGDYFCQYAQSGRSFLPCAKTIKSLKAGVYQASDSNNGIVFVPQLFRDEDLIKFDDSISEFIINEFDEFWKKKDLYEEYGEPHKRGYLLHGPPGSGKSCTVKMIISDFIKKFDGIVMLHSYYFMEGAKLLRLIEPNRKVLFVLEDLDSIIARDDLQQEVLQVLDGAFPLSNTVILATTNFPEKIPARIKNRPSRFDRVEEIGYPSEEVKRAYIVAKSKVIKKRTPELDSWIKDTKKFSLAHIKELILSTEVFGLDYDSQLKRLKDMIKQKETSDDYEKDNDSGLGFGRR